MNKYEDLCTSVEKSFGVGGVMVLLVFFLAAIVTYVINVVQFVNCDFEAPYRCEAVHGVGIVYPIVSLGTIWIPSDSK